MSKAAKYMHEVGMLNRTPRSGFIFLGSGKQSVSEHSFRMLHLAFYLARVSPEPVDELHLLHLVMFHDLPEARTSDLNYENQKYVKVDDEKVWRDLENELPNGAEIVGYIREFEARESPTARLANDADQLEFLLVLKEQRELGNPRADDWVPPLLARLKTTVGKQLAEEILATRSDEWWFGDRNDEYWIHRGREKNKRE